VPKDPPLERGGTLHIPLDDVGAEGKIAAEIFATCDPISPKFRKII
jgi:hypothetical protein